MLSENADQSPADWYQSTWEQLFSISPSYKFMHHYLVMITVRSTTSTNNSRKPWPKHQRRTLDVQGNWNAKVGKDAQADWGDICGLYCNVETNERDLRLLAFATFSTDKHPWPSQTIQKMDMAQPRWETPQPDSLHLGKEALPIGS